MKLLDLIYTRLRILELSWWKSWSSTIGTRSTPPLAWLSHGTSSTSWPWGSFTTWSSRIAEGALNKFSMMFRHFDMDKTVKLNLNAIKSCLRALGIVQQLVQGDGRLPHCQDETFLEPKNGQGITGTIVLFICFIRFLTFSLFEININYLSYKVCWLKQVYLFFLCLAMKRYTCLSWHTLFILISGAWDYMEFTTRLFS